MVTRSFNSWIVPLSYLASLLFQQGGRNHVCFLYISKGILGSTVGIACYYVCQTGPAKDAKRREMDKRRLIKFRAIFSPSQLVSIFPFQEERVPTENEREKRGKKEDAAGIPIKYLPSVASSLSTFTWPKRIKKRVRWSSSSVFLWAFKGDSEMTMMMPFQSTF